MANVNPFEFFQAFYPDPIKPGRLALESRTHRGGTRQSHWCCGLREVARLTQQYRNTRELRFGVALQNPTRALTIARQRRRQATQGSVRGCELSVTALPALWVEIPTADRWLAGRGAAGAPVHALPPDHHAALSLLEALPFPPSVVLTTTGGLCFFWFLEELWVLDSAEDRALAKVLLHRLRWALLSLADAAGWRIESGCDLAGSVPVPGTRPSKGPRANVERFPLSLAEARYHRQDFASLPEPPSGSDRSSLQITGGFSRGISLASPDTAGSISSVPVPFEPVAEGCSWLRCCFADSATLAKQEWQAALSMVGLCATAHADGRQLAHDLSRAHPGYTGFATDAELARVLRAAHGPRGCRFVADQLGAEGEHCAECPHFGRIESPLDLGREGDGPSDNDPNDNDPSDNDPPPSAGKVAGMPPTPSDPASGDDPQRIVITTRQKEVTDQALAALAGAGMLYQRGRMLVEVVADAPPSEGGGGIDPSLGSATIRVVREARLQELLATYCTFLVSRGRAGREEQRPAHPPRWVTRALLARGGWPQLPRLAGVVESPVLRADGSVLEAPGYDLATGLIHVPSTLYTKVPRAPSEAQCHNALGLLRDVVRDFQFARPAHFATWLSCLLTPLARPAFEGPAPLFLIVAGASRASRRLLPLATSRLLTGRRAAHLCVTRNLSLRQAIAGLALAGTRLALIEDIATAARSSAFAEALIADTWHSPQAGSGEASEIPLPVVWMAPCDGQTVYDKRPCDELPRAAGRSSLGDCALPIRLLPVDRPHLPRPGTPRVDLLGWIHHHRGEILPAALTLLHAYFSAGCPWQGLSGMGVHQGWSDLVRSTLVWLGVGDPAETRTDFEARAPAEDRKAPAGSPAPLSPSLKEIRHDH